MDGIAGAKDPRLAFRPCLLQRHVGTQMKKHRIQLPHAALWGQLAVGGSRRSSHEWTRPEIFMLAMLKSTRNATA
jgi:hypothetical protein